MLRVRFHDAPRTVSRCSAYSSTMLRVQKPDAPRTVNRQEVQEVLSRGRQDS